MHTAPVLLTAMAFTALTPAAVMAQQQAPRPPFANFAGARMSAAECEVWNRERDFAQSIHAHDPDAVAAFVHPEAIFQAGTAQATRGREAMLRDWAPIIKGKDIDFHWSPGVVNIGHAPDIAVSSGPVWFRQVLDGKPQGWRIGSFSSVWMRDADRQWRVRFDGTGERSKPATQAEVEALLAAIPQACPQS